MKEGCNKKKNNVGSTQVFIAVNKKILLHLYRDNSLHTCVNSSINTTWLVVQYHKQRRVNLTELVMCNKYNKYTNMWKKTKTRNVEMFAFWKENEIRHQDTGQL